jgi:drug/metabolite transporter (DMT)-like permease
MPSATSSKQQPAIGARLLVLVLAFCWGFNWIATAFALREVPPWSLRFISTGIGAIALIVAVWLSGRTLKVSPGTFRHIAVAGFCNVAVFNIFAAFAQLSGATSRTVIISYSMPIWSAVGAWLVLGDRLDRTRMLALALCVCGLTALLWPLFSAGVPRSALFALGCALGWTVATIYLKWADIGVDPLVNAAWQLAFGTIVIMFGMLAFDGYPRAWPIGMLTIVSIAFTGLMGTALGHFMWWTIVNKLPTTTAALGSLLVPVVGVGGSVILLAERPTPSDLVGFALIFAAAACVLLRPGVDDVPVPE